MAWKKVQDGGVLPSANGFRVFPGDSESIVATRSFKDGNWLEWFDDGVVTAARYEAHETATPNAAFTPSSVTGWTLYAMVQGIADEYRFDVDDGTKAAALLVRTGTVLLDGNSFTLDTRRPRQLRITGRGTTWKLFVDESDSSSLSITPAGASSGTKSLRFGTNLASARAHVRQIAWSEDGDFLASAHGAPDVLATYILPRTLRSHLPSLTQDALGDGDLAEIIRKAEEHADTVVLGADLFRTKRGFGTGGTETNEQHDYAPGGVYKLRYSGVSGITQVQYRTAFDSATWTTLSESSATGWYASQRDKELGFVRIAPRALMRADAVRFTYNWGYTNVPGAVQELTLQMALLRAFNGSLQLGQADVFGQRRTAIQGEIDRMREELQARFQPWGLT